MANWLKRIFFWWRYITGQARWDTGVTPPEIVHLIEDEKFPPGRALDLGCGTGTNVIYLVQHGWQATGVDFVDRAISEAQRKARQVGVAAQTQFVRGDVSQLAQLGINGLFDLAIDIGCAHSLGDEALKSYAEQLTHYVRPGGIYMLYMFRPTPERQAGLEPPEVEALFAPAFSLVWSDTGEDAASGGGSAWYRFERTSYAT